MRFLGSTLVILTACMLNMADVNAKIQVTIYQGDLALVSETRSMRIGARQQELAWPAVAAGLDPGSTHLTVTMGDALTLLEERYLPLPGTSLEMMTAYLGQPVDVRVAATEWIEGRLEAVLQGTLVLEQAGTQTLIPYGNETLVRLPDADLDQPPAPALIWQIDHQGAGTRTLELSYLTGGLTWTVDYFGEVNASEDHLTLSAKATIFNRCGMGIEDATVTLAAGTINPPAPAPQPKMLARGGMAADTVMEAAPAPQPEAMADLQFYPLAQPLTIGDQRQVQRLLIAPQGVACKRAYRYRSHRSPTQVTTALTLVNDEASGLGMPLPAGAWRLYRRTDDGLRFLGADQRSSATRNAELTLELGQAFDLHAERRLLQRRKLSARSEEQQVEIILFNGKTAAEAQIEVEEQIAHGQWEVTQSSLTPKRKDADTLVFDVAVPADGKTRLTYTVVRRW